MKNLKLYYWKKALVNYSSGCAFALAENSNEARKMIIEKYLYDEINRYCRNSKFWGNSNQDEIKKYIMEDDGFYINLLEELKEDPEVTDTKKGFYCFGGA